MTSNALYSARPTYYDLVNALYEQFPERVRELIDISVRYDAAGLRCRCKVKYIARDDTREYRLTRVQGPGVYRWALSDTDVAQICLGAP
jgi:hypothetical protein